MVTKTSINFEAKMRSRSFVGGGANKKYSIMEEKT